MAISKHFMVLFVIKAINNEIDPGPASAASGLKAISFFCASLCTFLFYPLFLVEIPCK
jgi:hypothetical protein